MRIRTKPTIKIGLTCALALGIALFCADAKAAGQVVIQGLNSVSQDDARDWVRDQITFIESSSASMAKADDVSYFLENALRDRGYKNATVEWKLDGDRILLTVSEGNTQRLGEISVTGNTALEDDAVRELITSATRKRMKLEMDDDMPYVAPDIKSGQARVDEFYQLLGYESVSIEIETTEHSGRTDLLVSIEEGKQHQVGTITFPEAPSDKVSKTYDEIRKEYETTTFSAAIPPKLASRLRAIAVDAGFYHATVEVTESERLSAGELETVNLVVSADWGPPVQLSGVNVSGNSKVTDSFFDKHFAELVDKPYSPEGTNKEVEELLETGAFETVRTDVVEQEDGTFALNVDVEEGYSRQLGVYGGFTNYEGAIGGFEFRNLNLFGSVRKIDAELEFSKRGARGELEFIDPWFLNTDSEFRAGLFAINRSEEGYEKFQTGGRYSLTKRFGRQMKDSVALFGEASYTDVHDADIQAAFLGDREYFAHSVGVSLTHDRRDQPRNPRSGYIAQGSMSLASSAIASETEFFKATGRLGYYHPVGNHTLRLAARAGMISPIGDTTAIPIDLRFFNGGAQSVRSFDERGLGMTDINGYPVGGEFYTTFNIEYEIPVKQFEGLSIVPFADAGNLIYDADDASLDNLRYAVGLGIRYETPIGPLRLEYGHNPDQRVGEPSGTLHIGFGFSY